MCHHLKLLYKQRGRCIELFRSAKKSLYRHTCQMPNENYDNYWEQISEHWLNLFIFSNPVKYSFNILRAPNMSDYSNKFIFCDFTHYSLFTGVVFLHMWKKMIKPLVSVKQAVKSDKCPQVMSLGSASVATQLPGIKFFNFLLLLKPFTWKQHFCG